MPSAVYGAPPAELAAVPKDALQASPLVVGAAALEDADAGSLDEAVVAAPAVALERRYVLAHALRVLAPGGLPVALVVLALELFTAWSYRDAFAPMLRTRTAPKAPTVVPALTAPSSVAR